MKDNCKTKHIEITHFIIDTDSQALKDGVNAQANHEYERSHLRCTCCLAFIFIDVLLDRDELLVFLNDWVTLILLVLHVNILRVHKQYWIFKILGWFCSIYSWHWLMIGLSMWHAHLGCELVCLAHTQASSPWIYGVIQLLLFVNNTLFKILIRRVSHHLNHWFTQGNRGSCYNRVNERMM